MVKENLIAYTKRMKKLSLMFLVVLLCVSAAQADSLIFRENYDSAGNPADPPIAYMGLDSQSLETYQGDWNGSDYYDGWCGGNFSQADARMTVLQFDDMLGAGAHQIPFGSTITSASLSVFVTYANGTLPTELRLYTGLTQVYNSDPAYGSADGDFSTYAFRQHDAGIGWGGGGADAPRHGIDYTAGYTAGPLNVAIVDQAISFDVTTDMQAFLDGALDNNGWWIGTEDHGGYWDSWRIAAARAGWGLAPILDVTYIPEPVTLVLLGIGSLAVLRRRR